MVTRVFEFDELVGRVLPIRLNCDEANSGQVGEYVGADVGDCVGEGVSQRSPIPVLSASTPQVPQEAIVTVFLQTLC